MGEKANASRPANTHGSTNIRYCVRDGTAYIKGIRFTASVLLPTGRDQRQVDNEVLRGAGNIREGGGNPAEDSARHGSLGSRDRSVQRRDIGGTPVSATAIDATNGLSLGTESIARLR